MMPQVAWSAPVRVGAELTRIARIDGRLATLARSLGATELQFPALIARDVLEHAEYPQAFPHLLMSASASPNPEAVSAPGSAWNGFPSTSSPGASGGSSSNPGPATGPPTIRTITGTALDRSISTSASSPTPK